MSFHTLKDGFPSIPLKSGMSITIEAIDPATGDPVAGVTASRFAIYGRDESEPPPEVEQPTEWLEVPFSH